VTTKATTSEGAGYDLGAGDDSGAGSALSDSLVVTWRNLKRIPRIPELAVFAVLQSVMFVLLFAYVFGGAINVPGGNYREYLIGGILVQSLAFGMTGPATAIATDLQEGVIDRFRSLPARSSAYLSGHFLAELGGLGLSIAILLTSGLLVGWRTHTPPTHVAGALLLLVMFAAAMVWVGTLIGLLVRTPDAVMGVGFTIVFPLTFLSNAFVPTATLPPVLRHIAEWNPVSTLVAAVRELFGNHITQVGPQPWPLAHAVPMAFVSCIAILAITVPLSLRRYRSRTTD
jgi:ABC-type polysaccharide/polyol phosphate export permease